MEYDLIDKIFKGNKEMYNFACFACKEDWLMYFNMKLKINIFVY